MSPCDLAREIWIPRSPSHSLSLTHPLTFSHGMSHHAGGYSNEGWGGKRAVRFTAKVHRAFPKARAEEQRLIPPHTRLKLGKDVEEQWIKEKKLLQESKVGLTYKTKVIHYTNRINKKNISASQHIPEKYSLTQSNTIHDKKKIHRKL